MRPSVRRSASATQTKSTLSNLSLPAASAKHGVADLRGTRGAASPKGKRIVLRTQVCRDSVGRDPPNRHVRSLAPFCPCDLPRQEHQAKSSITSSVAARSQATGSDETCARRMEHMAGSPHSSAACTAASRIWTSLLASASRTTFARQFAPPTPATRLRQRNTEAANAGDVSSSANSANHSEASFALRTNRSMICSAGCAMPSSSGSVSNAFQSSI